MTDQAIVNLKKKLDALSSKSSQKEKPTKIVEVTQPEVKPLPQQTKNPLADLTPEEIKKLKEQLGFSEPQQEALEEQEEVEEEEVPIEPTEEDLEQYKRIQAEIERLQNTGAFRTEVLYQYLGINVNLNRIATALEKLTGGNGKK